MLISTAYGWITCTAATHHPASLERHFQADLLSEGAGNMQSLEQGVYFGHPETTEAERNVLAST